MKKHITIDGHKVFFTDTGQGTPVLCIHGNPGCAEDFSHRAIEGFRIIALDRPGHGSSERYPETSGHLERQVRLIHAFTRALDLEPVILAGHSWGCLVALSYALAHPAAVQALLLMAPIAYARTRPASATPGLVRLMQLPVLGRLAATVLAATAGKSAITAAMTRGFAPAPMPEAYAQTVLPGFLTGAAFRVICEDKADFEFAAMEKSTHYHTLGMDTLIVCGKEDGVSVAAEQAERLLKTLPKATVVTVPDMGHQLPQCDPGLLGTLLQKRRSHTGEKP